MPGLGQRGTPERGEGVTVREYDRLFIDGDWVKSTGNETIEVISPGTEEVIGRVPASTEADHTVPSRAGTSAVRALPASTATNLAPGSGIDARSAPTANVSGASASAADGARHA